MPFVNHIKSGWVRTWINSFLNESPDISRFFAKVGKRIWKTHQLGMQKPNWTLLHVSACHEAYEIMFHVFLLNRLQTCWRCLWMLAWAARPQRWTLYIYLFLFSFYLWNGKDAIVHRTSVRSSKRRVFLPHTDAGIQTHSNRSSSICRASESLRGTKVLWCDVMWCDVIWFDLMHHQTNFQR